MTAEMVPLSVCGARPLLPSSNESQLGPTETLHTSMPSPEVAMATQMEEIGTELRRVRQVYGLTQTDISQLTGISRVTVSKLESDYALYANSMLRHLAAYAMELGYTLRLVLVADPAVVPGHGDEITALIRQVAGLALSREDGWTTCEPPDDGLSRSSVSYGGTEFLLLRNSEGRISVHAPREARGSIPSFGCVVGASAGT